MRGSHSRWKLYCGTEILPTSLPIPQALMERVAGARSKKKRDVKDRPKVRKDNLWMAHPKERLGRSSMVRPRGTSQPLAGVKE